MRKTKRATGAPAKAEGAFLLSDDTSDVRIRICKCCGVSGPETTLFRKAGPRCGHVNVCKSCDNARGRARYAVRREKIRQARRLDRLANLDLYRERNRKWAKTPKGREFHRAASARYKAQNPEKITARAIARRAEMRGDIKRPKTCQVKGCRCAVDLQKHHPRHDRPRDVIFLGGPRGCNHHAYVENVAPLPLKKSAAEAIGRKYARALKAA